VQRLETDGYIDGYVALVNMRKADCPMTIMVEITLSSQADEVLTAFEKALAHIPEVLECYLMTGSADYLLKVVAPDTEGFAMLHRKYLASLPGVGQMKSSIALRTVSKTTALPI
jgi:Lrp/AsnC family leucine-responsive transcriptional regulator